MTILFFGNFLALLFKEPITEVFGNLLAAIVMGIMGNIIFFPVSLILGLLNFGLTIYLQKRKKMNINNLFQILFVIFFLFSCKDDKKEPLPTEILNEISSTKPIKKDSIKRLKKTASKPYLSAFLKIEDALMNDNKIILEKKIFDELYPKRDSVKTEIWECGNPFNWLDDKWMIKTYGKYDRERDTFGDFDGKLTSIFTKNARFDTNNHIVLFNGALSKGNNLKIKSHQIVLDENTTLEEFQRFFPNLKKEELEHKNEYRFRIGIEKNNDDAFLFYFENGKLKSFNLWWLLC